MLNMNKILLDFLTDSTMPAEKELIIIIYNKTYLYQQWQRIWTITPNQLKYLRTMKPQGLSLKDLDCLAFTAN